MTGWRNTDWDDWRPADDEHMSDPMESAAWLVGLALLAVMAIVAFVLICIGVMT